MCPSCTQVCPYFDSLVCESIGKSVSIRTRVDHIRIQHSMSNQQSPNLRVAETGKRFNRTIALPLPSLSSIPIDGHPPHCLVHELANEEFTLHSR